MFSWLFKRKATNSEGAPASPSTRQQQQQQQHHQSHSRYGQQSSASFSSTSPLSPTLRRSQTSDGAVTYVPLHFICAGEFVAASQSTQADIIETSAAMLPLFRWCAKRLADELDLAFFEYDERSTANFTTRLHRFLEFECRDQQRSSFDDEVEGGREGGADDVRSVSSLCATEFLPTGEGVLCFCPFLQRHHIDPAESGCVTAATINSELKASASGGCGALLIAPTNGVRVVLMRVTRATIDAETTSGNGGQRRASDAASVFTSAYDTIPRSYSPVEGDDPSGAAGASASRCVAPVVITMTAGDGQARGTPTNRFALFERIRERFLTTAVAIGGASTTSGLTFSSDPSAATEMTSLPVSCVAARHLRRLKRRETVKILRTICKNIAVSEAKEPRYLSLMTRTSKFDDVINRYPAAVATLDALGFSAPSSEGTRILDAADAVALIPEMRRTAAFINELLPPDDREPA